MTTTLPAQLRRATALRQTALNTGTGVCGFLTVFGLSHLALIHITKLSGYLFFGALAILPPVIAFALARIAPIPGIAARRLAFGAVMCLLAVPFIYLARFFPAVLQASVRNILGLPFFVLALTGPGLIRLLMRRTRTVEV